MQKNATAAWAAVAWRICGKCFEVLSTSRFQSCGINDGTSEQLVLATPQPPKLRKPKPIQEKLSAGVTPSGLISAGLNGSLIAGMVKLPPVTLRNNPVDPSVGLNSAKKKMRTVPSPSGPVDAGPTVLTMRPVFEELFADVGEALSDHLTLHPLTTLARHYWSDGRQLDLFADREQRVERGERVLEYHPHAPTA